MKKIIILISIFILSTISINSYAQLNGLTHEEACGYKTVWKAPMKYGDIRYSDGVYYLCGVTNNKFEDTCATILLGKNKESAILSLDDLHKIISGETKLPKGGLIVRSKNNKASTIYRTMNGLTFKTEYVAGETYVLFVMRNKFDEAKEAIINFEEE